MPASRMKFELLEGQINDGPLYMLGNLVPGSTVRLASDLASDSSPLVRPFACGFGCIKNERPSSANALSNCTSPDAP